MKITHKCKNCKKSFQTDPSEIKTGRGIYCCLDCYREYRLLHGLTKKQRNNISIATKKAMSNPTVKKHLLDSYTEERKKKQSISAKKSMRRLKNNQYKYKKWLKSQSVVKKKLWKSLSKDEKQKRINDLINNGVKTHLKLLKTNKEYRTNFSNKFKGKNNPFYGKHHSKKLMNMIRKKQSITMSKLISEGKFNPISNKFKHGKYTSTVTHNTEHYASSYELIRMNQLDKMSVYWTKKHKIKIPYTDENNVKRNYIPDFLIENKILEEIKPQKLVNSKINHNCYKMKAAIKYCKNNNLTYRIITEKELGI